MYIYCVHAILTSPSGCQERHFFNVIPETCGFVDGSFNNRQVNNKKHPYYDELRRLCVTGTEEGWGVVEGWTAVYVTHIYSTVYVSLSERSGHLAF